jgi:choline dehydrogenase-like flavoprotein
MALGFLKKDPSHQLDAVQPILDWRGSLSMGKVVDRNFRVIGIDALRVVDGSIFILSLGTNGHPPVDSGSASIFRQ